MSNGPQAKATRDRKFFRKLARRENPIRFTVPLPADIDLEQISWKPTREELLLAWLANEKRKGAALVGALRRKNERDRP